MIDARLQWMPSCSSSFSSAPWGRIVEVWLLHNRLEKNENEQITDHRQIDRHYSSMMGRLQPWMLPGTCLLAEGQTSATVVFAYNWNDSKVARKTFVEEQPRQLELVDQSVESLTFVWQCNKRPQNLCSCKLETVAPSPSLSDDWCIFLETVDDPVAKYKVTKTMGAEAP